MHASVCNEAKSSGGAGNGQRVVEGLLSITTHAGSSSSRTLTQYWAKNQVREGNTHPPAIEAICGGLPTTSPHVDTHFLLWMAPLPHTFLAWMMHPCILLSHYPIGPV